MNFRRFNFALLLLLSTNTWQAMAGAVPGIANQRRPTDVLFMIDGSGSVKPHNFNRLRVLIKNIIDRMNVDYFSDQGCHVALIQFSSRKLTKVEFNLNTFNNKEDMKTAIDNMVYQRKYTFTGYAMELANKEVFNGPGDRPNAKNVVLLFTDGHAADPHIARAATRRMKSRGDHVMTVGFGPKPSIERFEGELQVMSSNKKKDVFLNGFDDEDNIVRRLVETSLPKSDCSISPCRNGARCENKEDSFICHCTEDYKGIICELPKGPCEKNQCLNDGICEENGDEFNCVCTEKFHGQLCEKEKVVCTTKNTDILIIMDDSRSIIKRNYRGMKNFVIELVYRFNISEHQSRVALMQFSSKENTRVEFNFDDYNYDKNRLMTLLANVKQSDGISTYTNVALKKAREEIFNGQNGDRTDVRDVIVLLTDGQSHKDRDAIVEAGRLRDEDVSIISIGIGRGEVNDDFYNFLKAISLGSEYAFKVSFTKLDTILDGVTKAACENLQDT